MLFPPIVPFVCPYCTRWLVTAATSSISWRSYFMVVLTAVCPMMFMTANYRRKRIFWGSIKIRRFIPRRTGSALKETYSAPYPWLLPAG